MSLIDEHCAAIIEALRTSGKPENLVGMARYGIRTDKAFGTNMPYLRSLAKLAGRNHDLALALWKSGWHEARILAALVDEPGKVTSAQMERWALDFDSWDLTDQCTNNLFSKTPFALIKVREWAPREEEFVKRAAFAMLASLAVHSRMSDEEFIALLPLIENAADDERNFVKKAVNWSLRQIGKRSLPLHARSVELALRLVSAEQSSARWIARDALRELQSATTIERIRKRKR